MNNVKRLAQAARAWLQYEFACNRSELFNERCLSVPIASALHAIYKQEVRAEYLHPILGPLKSGPGRRPEVDFAVISSYPNVSCVLESKWIGPSGFSIDDVVWDLPRLELIAHEKKADAFFLLAGRRKYLESFFRSSAFLGKRTSAGKYRSILKVRPAPRLQIAGPVSYRLELFRKIFEAYQDISFPTEMSMSVGHAYPEVCPTFQYQAYVWHVHAPQSIRRFLPRDHKSYGSHVANSMRNH